MTKRKRPVTLLPAVLLLALLTGCAGQAAGESAPRGLSQLTSLPSAESSQPVSSAASVSPALAGAPAVQVETVALSRSQLTLTAGNTAYLTASVSPKDAADTSVTWSSTDESVATVTSKGKVKGVQAGNCKIRAVSKNGKEAACTVTVSTVQPTPAPVPKTFHGSAFDTAGQVIVVTSDGMQTCRASVTAYEKVNGVWQVKQSAVSALIGQNGMVYDAQRRQESNTTPAGIYSIPFAFGWAENPGTKLSYKVADDGSYWDENSGSATYNRWVEGDPGGVNEQLKTEPLYKYAIVLDFNWSQQAGKGSGIFIHLKPQHYTGGCVGIDESVLVGMLQWLDPAQNPKVLICPQSDFSQYYS